MKKLLIIVALTITLSPSFALSQNNGGPGQPNSIQSSPQNPGMNPNAYNPGNQPAINQPNQMMPPSGSRPPINGLQPNQITPPNQMIMPVQGGRPNTQNQVPMSAPTPTR